MSEHEDSVTMKKWAKKFETAAEADRNAQKDMKKVISAAMKDEVTHKNIVRELQAAKRSGDKPHTGEGYTDDGELITGFGDARPWERD